MQTKKFIKGAVWGLIFGTVSGYLYHLKSNKEKQERMKQTAKKVISRLTQEINSVKDITKKEFKIIVDKVIEDFKKDKVMSKQAWQAVSEELDKNWSQISAEIKAQMKKKNCKK